MTTGLWKGSSSSRTFGSRDNNQQWDVGQWKWAWSIHQAMHDFIWLLFTTYTNGYDMQMLTLYEDWDFMEVVYECFDSWTLITQPSKCDRCIHRRLLSSLIVTTSQGGPFGGLMECWHDFLALVSNLTVADSWQYLLQQIEYMEMTFPSVDHLFPIFWVFED